MRQRITADRAIVPVSIVLITLAMMVLVGRTADAQNEHNWLIMVALGGVAALCVAAASRHLSAARRVRHELTGGDRPDIVFDEHPAQEAEDQRCVVGTQQPPRRAVRSQPRHIIKAQLPLRHVAPC
jgi:hypothetical protein